MKTPWLQRETPLFSMMPWIGTSLMWCFPDDWPEWRGACLLGGFLLFLWGATGTKVTSRGH